MCLSMANADDDLVFLPVSKKVFPANIPKFIHDPVPVPWQIIAGTPWFQYSTISGTESVPREPFPSD